MNTLRCSLFLVLATILVSCETYDSGGPGRSYAPAVSMPYDLNENEDRYLDTVGDVLESAGYRLSNSRSAEYELQFSIEDGPVNADTTITLLRNGSEVATSYARVGGPRIILNRAQVVRESFDKALRDFERRVPSAGGRSYDYEYNSRYGQGNRRDYDHDRYDDGYDSPRSSSPYYQY